MYASLFSRQRKGRDFLYEPCCLRLRQKTDSFSYFQGKKKIHQANDSRFNLYAFADKLEDVAFYAVLGLVPEPL